MEKNELIQKLKASGIHTKAHYLYEAFSRNIGLITLAEQARLHDACVAIPGMGGVGGVHLMTLVRMGVGHFHLADFDRFEAANINRQYGARVPDFGRNKLEVMKETALSVNPYIEIRTFPEGISDANLDDFLDGVQVVLDSLDYFEFDIRRRLFNRAREKGIYVVTAGPIGFSSAMLVFSPHEGMGFDEYFNIVSGMAPKEHYLAYAIGLAPRATQLKYMDLSRVDLDDKAGPSSIIACQLCAGTAATEAMRIILDKGKIKPVPYYFQFDSFRQVFRHGKISRGNQNPIQKIKIWYVKKFLLKKPTYKALKPAPPRWANPSGHPPKEIISYLVTMGTWAPSADNCQPWKFKWDGEALSLYKASERTGFFYDVNQESTLITFGAVIENIRIAASCYGLESRVDYLPDGVESTLIARIKFQQANISADRLFSHLYDRHTNRGMYNKKKIPENTVNELVNRDIGKAGVNILWIDDEPGKKVVREIVRLADRVLFEDSRLQGGLFKWIRKGIEPDGMGLDTLGLNFFEKMIFPKLSNWSLLNFINKFGASSLIASNSVKLLKSSPAYSLITIKQRRPLDYLRGGEAMERFWIKANSVGLSLQPMAGFLFLINHYYQDGGTKFTKKHRQMIQDIHTLYNSIIDGNSDAPLFFLRMGFSRPQNLKNQRYPVKEILTEP